MRVPGILLLASLSGPGLFAQPAAPTPARLPTPVYQEITVLGTPEEGALLRGVSDRLRSRLNGDAVFAKRVADAVNQSRTDEASRLILELVGVPGAAVAIVRKDRPAPADGLGDVQVHQARFLPDTARSPWVVRFTMAATPNHDIYACSSLRACDSARGRPASEL